MENGNIELIQNNIFKELLVNYSIKYCQFNQISKVNQFKGIFSKAKCLLCQKTIYT